MSDSFDVTPSADLPDASTQRFNDSLQRAGTLAQREGLPPTYRMRADRHYVEQIGADVGHPVRMLPLTSIESGSPEPDVEMRPLIESIRTLGIVHPLLVNRHQDRYHVIAGRKRFAAAQLLRLETVPCVVRDVGALEAAALAAADNLRTSAQRVDWNGDFSAVRQLAIEHLHRVMRASDLAVGSPNSGLDIASSRISTAHAWRAAYLIDAVDLLEHPPTIDDASTFAFAVVVDDVVRAFGAETQLRSVNMRLDVAGHVRPAVDRRQLTAALGGAMFATLAVIGETQDATILIRSFDRDAATRVLEVSQAHRTLGQAALNELFKHGSVLRQHIDNAATIGAVTARTIVERYGGTIEFLATLGTRLTMTFPAAVPAGTEPSPKP